MNIELTRNLTGLSSKSYKGSVNNLTSKPQTQDLQQKCKMIINQSKTKTSRQPKGNYKVHTSYLESNTKILGHQTELKKSKDFRLLFAQVNSNTSKNGSFLSVDQVATDTKAMPKFVAKTIPHTSAKKKASKENQSPESVVKALSKTFQKAFSNQGSGAQSK